jgi:hypothetical protein
MSDRPKEVFPVDPPRLFPVDPGDRPNNARQRESKPVPVGDGVVTAITGRNFAGPYVLPVALPDGILTRPRARAGC